VDTDPGCVAGTPTLPDTGTGTVTIPLTVAEATTSCRLLGLLLTDSAGDVSVYGSEYAPHEPQSPVATLLPTITALTGPAPELDSTTFSPATVPWATGGALTATLHVSSWGPGVTDASVTVGTANGETHPDRVVDGTVSVALTVPPHLLIGPQLVQVRLTDAAGVVQDTAAAGNPLTVVGTNGESGYVPRPPTRVLDTRTTTGGHRGALGAGGQLSLQLGLPADATAVVLNLTATDATAGGFLTAWPTGAARPTASNVNFAKGQTAANLVTVPLGTGGAVDVYNLAGSTDVVADLFGYYTSGSDAGSAYVPVAPHRLLDTRQGGHGPLVAGHPIQIQSGVATAEHPDAMVVNVTATNATTGGFVSLSDSLGTSNLNFRPGQTVANLAIVPTNGPFDIANLAGNVDVVVDLVGYFSLSHGSVFVPAGPTRVLDTRHGTGAPTGPIGPGGALGLRLGGQSGVPANATATVLNLTATGSTTGGFLTTWPAGTARPTASSVNFPVGATVPNLTMTGLGAGGALSIGNSTGSVQVVADLFGYYLPTATG
jgi:hypothetical protein